MGTVAAYLGGLACLMSPLILILGLCVIEAGRGESYFRDRADLERIRRGPPERWARPGVPSSSETPCPSCAVGIHAACDADCDCDCPWPFTPALRHRATIGR